jgi:hypothetical protein
MSPEDKQDPPLRIPRKVVDEDTPLRIRPDERTPPEGHDPVPVHVPEKEWLEHGRRKDTATGLATEDEPVE